MAIALEDYTRLAYSLYALPCPPLPQLALKGEDGETDFISSHDTLMAGMVASLRLPEKQRAEQAERKMEALQSFTAAMEAIVGEGPKVGTERVYEVMCDYTRTLTSIYTGRTKEALDVRFAPLDAVCRGDQVHVRATEHLSLHHCLCTQRSVEPRDVAHLSYANILLCYLRYYVQEVEEVGGRISEI